MIRIIVSELLSGVDALFSENGPIFARLLTRLFRGYLWPLACISLRFGELLCGWKIVVVQGDFAFGDLYFFEDWSDWRVKIVFDQAVPATVGHQALAYGKHFAVLSEILYYWRVVTAEISGYLLAFLETVLFGLNLNRVTWIKDILLDLWLFECQRWVTTRKIFLLEKVLSPILIWFWILLLKCPDLRCKKIEFHLARCLNYLVFLTYERLIRNYKLCLKRVLFSLDGTLHFRNKYVRRYNTIWRSWFARLLRLRWLWCRYLVAKPLMLLDAILNIIVVWRLLFEILIECIVLLNLLQI